MSWNRAAYRHRASRRLATLSIVISSMALMTANAAGQSPNNPPVSKTYINKSVVSLPIVINSGRRAELREIQLFVKTHPVRPWAFAQRVQPSKDEFLFRAKTDGEYWFAVVTVDRFGRKVPANMSRQLPQRVVVIDRDPPQVKVRCLPKQSTGRCVHVKVADDNLDLTSVKFEYQTRDMVWRSTEEEIGRPGVFCIPQQAMLSGKIRVSARDRAGNTLRQEMHMQDCLENSRVASHATDGSVKKSGNLILQHSTKKAGANAKTGPELQLPPVPNSGLPNEFIKAPALLPPPILPELKKNSGKQADTSVVKRVSTPPAPPQKKMTLKVLRNPRVILNYQVQKQSESGIGKVEIWMSDNLGRSWQRLAEDPDKKSPAVILLPGQGVYGLRLVASNSFGFGGEPPKTGDSPDWLVEIDTSAPTAKLFPVTTIRSLNPGTVMIRWVAADKNLDDAPIQLEYARTSSGPWLPIAKKVKNSGQYPWLAPTSVRKGFFVRLTVTDRAGNSTVVRTSRIAQVDDLSCPIVRIQAIEPAPPGSSSSKK